MLRKAGFLVALVSLVAHVASAYIIDNMNNTIIYSPLDMFSVGISPYDYNGTSSDLGYHPTGCRTSDDCQISFPFTGEDYRTGITLYATVGWALSFDISIDGMVLSQLHFGGVYGCCNAAIYPAYNFAIYNVQNLSLGNHALVLSLLDTYGYVWGTDGLGSVISFEYAVVNETATPPFLSPSASPSASPSPPHKRIAPIIGGALGSTAALALAALAVIYIRRRAHKAGAEDPDTPIIVSDKQEQEQPVIAAGLHHDPAPVLSLGEGSSARATATYQLRAGGEVPLTTAPFSTSPSYPPPHYETPIPPTPQSRAEEESLFLARMYKLGVPATEIARAAEAMRAQG